MIIYKIENKINGKIYIGQTKRDLSLRIAEHIKNNFLIGKALRKYGIDAFIVATIDSCDVQEMIDEKEKYWIRFLNCKVPNGYNLTDGGDGVKGNTQIAWNKGIACTEEMKQQIAQTLKGNIPWNKGLKNCYSDKVREKMSKSHEGKKLSNEIKKKMSESRKGRIVSIKTRKKISISNKGKHREKQSEESNIKRSETLKGRISPMKGKYHTEETRRKMSKTHRLINVQA